MIARPCASCRRAARAGKRLLVAACFGAVLGACSVGPRYAVPQAPAAPAYKEIGPVSHRGADDGAWQPAQPQDGARKGKWWEVFAEPELDGLEDRLNIDNQSIAQYFQNFLAARAQVQAARAGFFPTVSTNPSFARNGQGSAAATTGAGAAVAGGVRTTHNLVTLPFDASWEPDLWGRIASTLREYQFAAQVSAADLENLRLTEQANLAVFYFELRGQDALQDLYDRTVDADRSALAYARAQSATGIGNDEAVAQAEITLENAEVAGIGIAADRAVYEHAIATLIGQPASNFALAVRDLATPMPAIPIGVPSQLLQRRPDIAAAERQLARTNAAAGVAAAAYYPSLVLTGGAGFESRSVASLLALPALFWSLGASATETLFDGGLRSANTAQATANYNSAVAAYRQTVLSAMEQVEDSLATVRVLSRQLARQESAVAAARRYLSIATSRYQAGLDPYLNVINAQTTLLGDEQTLITLRVSELTAATQLIQALGGGWDVAQLP